MDENRFWILAAKKLSGDLNPQENSELELLFVSNPGFKELLDTLEQKLANHLTPGIEIDEEKTVNNLRAKLCITDPEKFGSTPHQTKLTDMEEKPSFWRVNQRVLILSTCFILLAIALFSKFLFHPAVNEVPKTNFAANNISTKPGSKSLVTLPDGTLVILNADSKLSYPDNFLGATRDVTLEGEAFFEVTENKAKPFIIHSKAMDIKVLGTVFNVKAYPNEITSEASLIKGSIEVTLNSRRNDKIMLKPSEKITVANSVAEENNLPKKGEPKTPENLPLVSLNRVNYDKVDSLVNEIAWVQNRLVFNNESFGNIIVLLERWYGKKIELKTLSHKQFRFTGKFNNETIDQVLKALQLSHKFIYKRENDIIIIS